MFRTPPAHVFYDPAYLKKELDTVFRKSWLCVPKQWFIRHIPGTQTKENLLDALQLRGGAVKFSLLGEEMFFKRDFEPEGNPALHCFSNICPHHFSPLMLDDTDKSRNNFIRCPYHNLVTDCQGMFKSHPAFPNPSAEERAALNLTQYQFREWGDFFFIARDSNPRSLSGLWVLLKSLEKLFPFTQAKYAKLPTEHRRVEGNFKLHGSNFVDTIHIKHVHKAPHGLADALDMDSYTVEICSGFAFIWAYARNKEHAIPNIWHTRFKKPVYGLWLFKPPEFFLNIYQWGYSVNVLYPALEHPEYTDFYWYHYIWDEKSYANSPVVQMMNLTDSEDTNAMRETQKNLNENGPERCGILNPETEIGPYWFYSYLQRLMK